MMPREYGGEVKPKGARSMRDIVNIRPVIYRRSLALVGAAAFMCIVAQAQAADGWYVQLDAGAAFLSDSTSTATDGAGNSITFDTEFDTGFGVHAALGHSWDPYRLEAEVSYRRNDFDTFDITNVTAAGIGSFNTAIKLDGDGDVSALGLMVNGWYDVNTGSPWRPFVGGGLGLARISVNDASATVLGVSVLLADDDDWVFAYQAGAGVGYEVNPNTVISLGYRFFATADPDFTTVDGDPFDAEYQSHNIEIGVRFFF